MSWCTQMSARDAAVRDKHRRGVSGRLDILFIAVGTPTESNGGGANLRLCLCGAVEEAARAIAAQTSGRRRFHSHRHEIDGSGRHKLEDRRLYLRSTFRAEHFAVASNPEFLREGNAIAGFHGAGPNRGRLADPNGRAQLLEELYMPLTRKGRPLVVTSTVETAELIKYAANAFLATKVTFINEMARLCEAIGADVRELALGVGMDNRIGTDFFAAGPGFGGSCFPKDLRALVKTATDFGSPVEIVETVIRANDRHKQMMVKKIRSALGGSLPAADRHPRPRLQGQHGRYARRSRVHDRAAADRRRRGAQGLRSRRRAAGAGAAAEAAARRTSRKRRRGRGRDRCPYRVAPVPHHLLAEASPHDAPPPRHRPQKYLRHAGTLRQGVEYVPLGGRPLQIAARAAAE